MKPIVLLLAASFCNYSVPSRADWQYTKWGMTLEQVIAASGGKVKLPNPAFVARHCI